MPYVNVPNDLSKIKTKIAFNLTKRQLGLDFGQVIGDVHIGHALPPLRPRPPLATMAISWL